MEDQSPDGIRWHAARALDIAKHPLRRRAWVVVGISGERSDLTAVLEDVVGAMRLAQTKHHRGLAAFNRDAPGTFDTPDEREARQSFR